ncbi:pikachurin-like [Plakobranchus ocellatus]|uniref:Pikachurin-like n=1 Tax=Plakobranchus ocellatus TaxID=259542 RepID=A0AAV4BRI7_9GAST|nr:pikachurin-like [Plakobranchus ocellatus]
MATTTIYSKLLLTLTLWVAFTAIRNNLVSGSCARRSGCEQICVDVNITSGEYSCQCRRGYKLHTDNETCVVSPVPKPFLTANNSYVELPSLSDLVPIQTIIELTMKPTSLDGTILFTGYSVLSQTADFILLTLEGGHVVFRYDLGSGPAEIRSLQSIENNTWISIKASRWGRVGVLRVNGDTGVVGLSLGTASRLNLKGYLYLGRHPSPCLMPQFASSSISVTGCVEKVVINYQTLDLNGPQVKNFIVDNCSPCSNGGPCQNGGICKDSTLGNYMCLCPCGFNNTNCETAQDRIPRIAKFTGDGYLMYTDDSITRCVQGARTSFLLTIKPLSTSGLIFWSGQSTFPSVSGHGKQFIALNLCDGMLQLRFNLGTGDALVNVSHPTLFDGNYHTIRVQRTGNRASLSVGRSGGMAISPGSGYYLRTNRKVYLGAVPDMWEVTEGRYSTSFEGCLRTWIFEQCGPVVMLTRDFYVAANIENCLFG